MWLATLLALATSSCPAGQAPEASGKCCWPGQTFGEQSQRCRGTPTCPEGFRAELETCSPPACPAGMTPQADPTKCCWPEQEWSTATNACIGVAQCPAGFERDGDACRPTPPAPECAAGQSKIINRCVDDALAARITRWGPRSLLGGFTYEVSAYATPSAPVTTHQFGYELAYHLDGRPLLLETGGGIGAYRYYGAPCPGSGGGCLPGRLLSEQVWWARVGVAFAPFTGPIDAEWGVSPWNPFIGVDVTFRAFISPKQRCNMPLGCAVSPEPPPSWVMPALVVGDVLMVGEGALMVRAGVTFPDGKPAFIISVTAGVLGGPRW